MDIGFIIAQVSDSASSIDPSAFNDLAPPIQIALFLGAMSFATAALVSLTAFTRIVIVLSFVRRALSTQEIPPNQVMIGLSLFLTIFVMAPTFDQIYQTGIVPYLSAQKQDDDELKSDALKNLMTVGTTEIKSFMLMHTRTSELDLFVGLSNSELPVEDTNSESELLYDINSIELKVLIPAFIISELKTAFIMGFCIYIPFLLIDLVISTVLMSLGMMMMPPVIISTPCKLLLFVLVDGWMLISSALMKSYGVGA